MKISELIERLIEMPHNHYVVAAIRNNKYACGRNTRGGDKMVLLISQSPQTVASLISELRIYAVHGDMEIDFAFYGSKFPLIGAEYDGRHAVLSFGGEATND